MRQVAWVALHLFGCHDEFVFEITVAGLEPDMVVLADGEEQQIYMGTSSLMATFTRPFDRYDDAIGVEPTELLLIRGADQEVFRAELSPGLCASDGDDWTRERFYVGVEQDPARTWTASVRGYECVSPSRRIISVP